MIFPIMIHGNIAGIAAITGLPVMKNDVTGVITVSYTHLDVYKRQAFIRYTGDG